MGIRKIDMIAEFGRFRKASIFFYIFLGIAFLMAINHWPEACSIIKKINIIVGLFCAYNVSSWLLANNKCKVSPFLAGSSFFIYVAHSVVYRPIFIAFTKYIPSRDPFVCLSFYLLTLLLSLGILLAMFYTLRRCFPDVLKIVAGRK